MLINSICQFDVLRHLKKKVQIAKILNGLFVWEKFNAYILSFLLSLSFSYSNFKRTRINSIKMCKIYQIRLNQLQIKSLVSGLIK